MNLNEINFSFAGKHCLRDFGCIYVENGGHTISPKVTRNAYQIAGLSGTILMPGEIHDVIPLRGSLFFEESPPSQAAAQNALRRIVAWLAVGRDKLFFDYEPNRYYLAEVNSQTDWTFANWIDGGLDIQFECQPFAYNRVESSVQVTVTGLGTTLQLVTNTGKPTPLCMDIKNLGSAIINSVTVTVDDKKAAFTRNLSITTNKTLYINMEAPAGATIDTQDAMLTCTRFDYITVPQGPQRITVSLGYGTGTRNVIITAHARGRF